MSYVFINTSFISSIKEDFNLYKFSSSFFCWKEGSKYLFPTSKNNFSIPALPLAEVNANIAPILFANSLASSSGTASTSYKSDLFPAIPSTTFFSPFSWICLYQ